MIKTLRALHVQPITTEAPAEQADEAAASTSENGAAKKKRGTGVTYRQWHNAARIPGSNARKINGRYVYPR